MTRRRLFLSVIACALVLGGLLWIRATGQVYPGIVLQSATIQDDNVTLKVVYTKTIAGCQLIKVPTGLDTHPFACDMGSNIEATMPIDITNLYITPGVPIQLCLETASATCTNMVFIRDAKGSTTPTIVLHDVYLQNSNLNVVYSTNINGHCLRLWTMNSSITHPPFICKPGVAKLASAPVSKISPIITAGMQLRLCDETDSRLCSGLATVRTGAPINPPPPTSVQPKFFIAGKTMGATDTLVKNQKNVNLLRFETMSGEASDILFTTASFLSKAGSPLNAENYTLWADTNNDGTVDTALQTGISAVNARIKFDALKDGGVIIPRGKTTLFEVHADIVSNLTDNKLQLQFATADADYVKAALPSGTALLGIQTDTVPCQRKAGCEISVVTAVTTLFTIASQANLYVTKSTVPLPSRQSLGGTVGEPILRLDMRAENESIDVTNLYITSTAATRVASINRLDLYKEGATTPFASASPYGCGAESVPPNTYCTTMSSHQLIIAKGTTDAVLVRPVMNSDTDGGLSNEDMQLRVSGPTSVQAIGAVSGFKLAANNGNSIAEGEVFIGTSNPGPNAEILGNHNRSVLSKITSITNANPDSDGTVIPYPGAYSIGQFKFVAAPNSNSQNGLNKIGIRGIIFTVTETNVGIDASSLRFYNMANGSVKVPCQPFSLTGNPLTGTIDSSFRAFCTNLSTSALNRDISQGESAVFALEMTIINPQISSSKTSTLQVSLQNFTDINRLSFGDCDNCSNFVWEDKDAASSKQFYWVEYPETVVKSTMYRS